MSKYKLKDFLFLHIVLIMYSVGAIFSKIAASKEFLSLQFIFYYGLVIVVLFLYAILWQQILKKLPLTIAFANKAIVVVWGIIWGKLLFGEIIKLNMVIGAIIIVVGIYCVVADNEY
jgi:drug/metabolite transporter (DMT)-like permease